MENTYNWINETLTIYDINIIFIKYVINSMDPVA